RISQDHSWVAEAVTRGQSEEEALESQWKNALTRSIGTDTEVTVDVFGPFPVEPDTAVLLCSDGLYKSLSDAHLRRVFAASRGPRGAVQALVASAYEAGSDDNITVALAEFGEVTRARRGDAVPPGAGAREDEAPPAERETPTAPGNAAVVGDERDQGSWWKIWRRC
ncbi:MAG TPA: hypothetical protein VJ997_00840, partial [Longimicrobiales bacterium]|nr:hypothetical protein [Longimicrobiales bacterium]